MLRLPKQAAAMAVLAALGVVMQGSAAILPGPGHVLAAAASLPAAVAAWLFGRRAAAVWVTATLLLAVLVKPEEAMIYGLSTAPVGLGASLSP